MVRRERLWSSKVPHLKQYLMNTPSIVNCSKINKHSGSARSLFCCRIPAQKGDSQEEEKGISDFVFLVDYNK